jgi:hypothetical protein
LFKRFSNTVARKVVTFKRDTDISCALNYEVPEDSPLPLPKGTDPRLGVFDIKVSLPQIIVTALLEISEIIGGNS